MNIDASKANLLEKDIEDWLYENPQALYAYYASNPITKWIGRQYALPSGIADLIGVRENGMLAVVEVKNVPINKAAVLQVCRYALDLKYIVSDRSSYAHTQENGEPIIEMLLVGPSIDDQTFYEAQAVNVRVFRFSVQLSLDINSLSWADERRTRLREERSAISERPEWAIFGLTPDEQYEQDRIDAIEARFEEVVENFAREQTVGCDKGEYSDVILVDIETDDGSEDDPF